jgi:hypothetical protein
MTRRTIPIAKSPDRSSVPSSRGGPRPPWRSRNWRRTLRLLDCSHGGGVCQGVMATSLFGWCHLFVPAAKLLRMARTGRVKAGASAPPHCGLALSRASTPSGLCCWDKAERRAGFRTILHPLLAIQVRALCAIWFAGQTKLTSGRRTQRLRHNSAFGGQAREGGTHLRDGF